MRFLLLAAVILLRLPGVETREISCTVTVPSGGYTVAITEVHEAADRLLVLVVVTPPAPDLAVTAALESHRATISVPAPDKPAVCHVIGKTWTWDEDGGTYTVLTDPAAFAGVLATAGTVRRLHPPSP
jgi:hypothetical protein